MKVTFVEMIRCPRRQEAARLLEQEMNSMKPHHEDHAALEHYSHLSCALGDVVYNNSWWVDSVEDALGVTLNNFIKGK